MTRIAFVDFEASSLDESSYPIEVGVAIWDGFSITSWGCLIKPTSEWRARDAWSRSSQRVHGISRNMLIDGFDPHTAMQTLAEFCRGVTVAYCDGGEYDRRWLSELDDASRIASPFALLDLDALLEVPGHRAQYTTRKRELALRHRAQDDAEALLRICLNIMSLA